MASYTGWEYEYVEGSWVELFHMLENGEIDILTDVSYTEERAEKILYPTIPMGQEMYYIYIDSDNTEIKFDDLSTLNGKTVGVMSDSVQLGLFLEWEDQRNQLHIAIGVAVYDPENDRTLEDTIKRADDLMYENKRKWKEQNK